MNPAVPMLADDGIYLASESTFSRVLKAHGQTTHRGRAKAPKQRRPPTTHIATEPRQVWCWDMTYLPAKVQGTAADLIKMAMIAVQGWLEASGLQSRLALQVHDELVLEVPDDELTLVRLQLARLMGQVARLKVPLVVEVGVGPNWEAAH